MILDLRLNPDPILKSKSAPVRRITKDLVEFGKNLIETMDYHKGVGLSGVQVGQLIRVLCMTRNNGSTLLMYNPIIVSQSPTRRAGREGCLSFVNEEYIVKRPLWVKVKYTDKTNKIRFANLEGLESVIFMHEHNHLDGITFDTVGVKL
jgi:peptide deformylase